MTIYYVYGDDGQDEIEADSLTAAAALVRASLTEAMLADGAWRIVRDEQTMESIHVDRAGRKPRKSERRQTPSPLFGGVLGPEPLNQPDPLLVPLLVELIWPGRRFCCDCDEPVDPMRAGAWTADFVRCLPCHSEGTK